MGSSTWTTPGGDFISTPSGGAAISQTGDVNISNGGLIADVQAWANNAANNFGWAIVGNTEGAATNARRFASRDNTTVSVRPQLTITYTNPLPVSLISFTASLQTNKALLTWKTASENNNSHFNVEQSIDGRNFKSIGKVMGAGNSSIEKNYSFLHSAVAEGKNYYRLAQVDFDGTTKYSSIVSLNFLADLKLRIEPNPVQSTLVVQANSSIVGKSYYITNTAGKMVKNGNLTAESINIATIASGVYILNVEVEGRQFKAIQFVKQ